ncbi:hypothetical protein SAMN05444266_110165 [Chitinophaga jiangningensis]|uniref:Uncharacterized protein n=1 Tax=Chitinophaga jiangningensis TaxID=1419482 RepID=A0A1M7L759_9BACT|nr:hypothetical protein [Chitinophaga jiangningensis]SHM73649.1 hypothetical protein SAMN05444266_110165 [Chitinophaga jiangningensis]
MRVASSGILQMGERFVIEQVTRTTENVMGNLTREGYMVLEREAVTVETYAATTAQNISVEAGQVTESAIAGAGPFEAATVRATPVIPPGGGGRVILVEVSTKTGTYASVCGTSQAAASVLMAAAMAMGRSGWRNTAVEQTTDKDKEEQDDCKICTEQPYIEIICKKAGKVNGKTYALNRLCKELDIKTRTETLRAISNLPTLDLQKFIRDVAGRIDDKCLTVEIPEPFYDNLHALNADLIEAYEIYAERKCIRVSLPALRSLVVARKNEKLKADPFALKDLQQYKQIVSNIGAQLNETGRLDQYFFRHLSAFAKKPFMTRIKNFEAFMPMITKDGGVGMGLAGADWVMLYMINHADQFKGVIYFEKSADLSGTQFTGRYSDVRTEDGGKTNIFEFKSVGEWTDGHTKQLYKDLATNVTNPDNLHWIIDGAKLGDRAALKEAIKESMQNNTRLFALIPVSRMKIWFGTENLPDSEEGYDACFDYFLNSYFDNIFVTENLREKDESSDY